MKKEIPITFEHKGKTYTGELSPVAGMGHPSVWHLLIDKRYIGCLMHTKRGWVFHSEIMPEIAEFLGEYVTAWYE